MKERTAIYARVSSDQQSKQKTIESQVFELRERVLHDGARTLPVDEFIDDGVSGTTLLRPGLESLRDRVAEGLIDRIYIHSPDRLARKFAYQAILLEEFKRAGVEVNFLNGASGDDSPEGSLLTGVQGVIAEYERSRILERTRRGRLHKARTGQASVLTSAPFGFRFVRRAGGGADFVVHAVEAAVVGDVFRWLIEDKMSLSGIALRLAALGVPTSRGGRWTGARILNIVRNPAYKGEAHFGKSKVGPAPSPRVRPAMGRQPTGRGVSRTRTPAHDHIVIPVPPIIAPGQFELASLQLARNRELSPRGAKPRTYLLQGLLRCGLCRHAYCGYASRVRGEIVSYYRCSGRISQRAAGLPVCTAVGVRVGDLDAHVWDSVVRIIEEPSRVVGEWLQRNDADGTRTELRERRDVAARGVKVAEAGLVRLLDAYEAGLLELAELNARSTRARERVAAAVTLLDEAEVEMRRVVELTALTNTVETFAAKLRQGIGAASFVDRQRVVRALVKEVSIDGEHVRIIYQIPGATSSSGEPAGASNAGGDRPGLAGPAQNARLSSQHAKG